MGLLSGARRGLPNLFNNFAVAQAYLNGDYGVALSAQQNAARLRQAQQEAEAEAAEAQRIRDELVRGAKGTLGEGETINPLLYGAIQANPEALAATLGSRFETRNVAPDSEVVTPSVSAGGSPISYRVRSAPTELERNIGFLRRENYTPEFVDRVVERELNPDQWVTPPAGGYAEDVTRRVPLRPAPIPGASQMQGQTPPIAPPISAQGAAPQEVTATNPQTGERIRLNPQTGQWEPIQGGAGRSGPQTFPEAQDWSAFGGRFLPRLP